MNNIWKRSLSLLLAFVMIVGMVPMGVLADEQEDFVSDTEWEESVPAADEEVNVVSEAESAEICSDGEETAELDSSSDAANAEAATVDIDPADADGVIWLNKDKEDELLANVMSGGLRDMILVAVGKSADGSEKVCYKGYDVSNAISMAMGGVAYELADAITAQKTVLFTIDGADVSIVCRNIKNAVIAVETVTIKSDVALSNDQVKAMVEEAGVNYTITHNGDDLTKLSTATVTCSDVTYTWPEKGDTKEYSAVVTVTLRDSLDLTEKVGTGKVVLEDTTPKYTVTYVGANNAVVATYTVVEGGETPKPSNPVRSYYNFKAWNPTVASTVTQDATYTATWTAQLDVDGNGVADQEQEFTITYYNEDSVYATLTAAWGQSVPKPAENPTRQGYTFVSWMPVGGSASSTVTNNVSYKAYWVEEEADDDNTGDDNTGDDTGSTTPVTEYAVKYVLVEGEAEFTLKTKGGLAQDVPYTPEDASTDCVVWLGWYTAEGTAYDFTKAVTDDSLVLYACWAEDSNNNEKADGTAEDPYTTYVFMFNEDTVMYSKTVWGSDAEFDPNKISYPESIEDEKKFDVWDIVTSDNDYAKTVTCKPVFKADVNHNDVFDADETVELSVVKPEGIENAGKIEVTVMDRANKAFVTTKETVDGAFLRNSSEKYGEATIVTVTPVAGKTYVKEIVLTKNEQVATLSLVEETSEVALSAAAAAAATGIEIEYAEDYSYVTCTLPTDKGAYSLEVVYADATQLLLKDKQDELECGVSYNGEAVYNAVVESPVYSEDADITVKYQARAEMTGENRLEVNVQELYDTLMAYGDTGKTAWNYLKNYVFNFVEINGEYYYTRDLEAVWLDLDNDKQPTSAADAQTIADDYIETLKNTPYDQLLDKVTNIYDEKVALDAKLDASMIHPFGYNGNAASEVTEYVSISYSDGRQLLTAETTVKLVDDRAQGSIEVPEGGIEFVYGTPSSDDYVKSQLTLNGGKTDSSLIELSGTCYDKNAGTYKITASFDGNDAYKPCTTTFTLTVNKAPVTLTVEKIINTEPCDKSSTEYAAYAKQAAPKTTPAGVSTVSVIAGLDMAEINLNLEKPNLSEGQVKAWAWVKIPESMEAMLSDKYDLTKTYTLDDINRMLEENRDQLAAIKVAGHAVDAILDQLSEYVEFVGVDVEITFKAKDEYPTDAGTYLNFAVTVDGNYETEVDAGVILIDPFIALPNRGDVQLVYENESDAQNLFSFRNEGIARELKMTYKGKYVDSKAEGVSTHIYYYGIDSQAKLYYDGSIPSKPGVYVVAGVYTKQDGAGNLVTMGTDAVLMVIGMSEVTIDVARDVRVKDGTAQISEITVTDKETGKTLNDAALTVISGTVDADVAGEAALNSLTGTISIDFPAGVKDLWDRYVAEILGYKELPENYTINVQTVKNFVEWCIKNVSVPAKVSDKMISMGVPANYIAKAEDYTTAAFIKVKNALNKFPTDKLNAEVNLSFTGTVTGYTDTGVYLYYGIVTDPDYVPAANAGVLVITEDPDDLVMFDTHTPYNGSEQQPVTYDNTGRDGLTIILERDQATNAIKSVNFDVDEDLAQVIKTYIEETIGKKIVGNSTTVGTLNNTGKNWVNCLTNKIVDKIEFVAKNRLGVNVDLSDELAAVRTRVYNKLASINKLDANVTIAVDGSLPVNVGNYEFITFSYGLVYAHAMLYIEPVHVEITPADFEKTYGDADPADLKEGATVRYYGYYSVGGAEPVKVDVPLTDDAIAALNLEYAITREQGEDVGVYDLIVTGSFAENSNFVDEVEQNGGTLTINPKTIEVEIPNFTKYYGADDPDGMVIVLEGAEYGLKDGEKITITLSYVDKNVGEHSLTVDISGDKANHDIVLKYVDGADKATITIEQAQIVLNADDLEISVGDLEYELTYTLNETESNGRVTEEELKNVVLTADVKTENGWNVLGEYAIVSDGYETKNYKIVVNPGTLTVTTGDYVCWNMQTGVYYDDLSDALEDVEDENTIETIQMLKDFVETDNIYINPGTTLDLDVYTVTAMKHVVGLEGSYLDGNVYAPNGSYGKLIVNKTFNLLIEDYPAQGSYIDDMNYNILPVYNSAEGGYVFSRFEVNTDQKKVADRGLEVDLENDTLYFQFGVNMTGAIRNLLTDGASDNEVSFVVRLEWDNNGGDGTAFQNFVYNDGHIMKVVNERNDCTLTITGCEELDMDISTLKVKAMIVTESGAIAYSPLWEY